MIRPQSTRTPHRNAGESILERPDENPMHQLDIYDRQLSHQESFHHLIRMFRENAKAYEKAHSRSDRATYAGMAKILYGTINQFQTKYPDDENIRRAPVLLSRAYPDLFKEMGTSESRKTK